MQCPEFVKQASIPAKFSIPAIFSPSKFLDPLLLFKLPLLSKKIYHKFLYFFLDCVKRCLSCKLLLFQDENCVANAREAY